MKTNRTYQRSFAALALIFALAACTVDLTGPETGETIPPGMGLASIRLNGGSALTAVPDMSTYYFTLDFTAQDKIPVNKTLDGTASMTLTVALEPATWTLEVKGYADDDMNGILVSGTINVPITAGTSANFNVSLAPAFSSGGTGTLAYDIDFPSTVSWAVLGLYPLDNTLGAGREIDISTTKTGTPTLSEGSYQAVIDLYDGTTSQAAAWTEVVHIYDGSTTVLEYEFAAGNFAAVPTEIEDDEGTLAAKLDAALDSGSGSYTIVLNSETDLGTFAPKTLNVTGNKNISVTIRGGGKTVQVNQTGTPLFTLGADAGSSLTLTLQDLTLTGLSGNSVPVVRVNQRGTLVMKAGSLITGNASYSSGGGVYVYNGTFTMSGGEVRGNTSNTSNTSYGGGVHVSNGTFTMSGGKVSGNTASSSRSGGGVHVSGGTFTMSGGEVSGNTASSSYAYGGGVHVSGGTFTMSGGKVSGNTASSSSFYASGGGVYVVDNGTFTMSGGAVSGNTASSSSSSASASGGGVSSGVYYNDGTFTMSGGEVRDNILSGANTYGKEVVVNGTFKMSGDARPQRVFLDDSTRFITISGPLSGGIVPIDLGISSSNPLASWENKPVLVLDSSYSAGNLASLKTHFTLENAVLMTSPYTEMPLPAGYTIGDDGRLPPLPSSSGISDIAYTYGGNTWTLEGDGRYKSPVIGNNATTKERVEFTTTGANAFIVVLLEVSSQVPDGAFISTLDNASAAYDSGSYPGSFIYGTTSAKVFIPVPTAGSHFIEICYRKDGSDTGGSDCAWFTVLE